MDEKWTKNGRTWTEWTEQSIYVHHSSIFVHNCPFAELLHKILLKGRMTLMKWDFTKAAFWRSFFAKCSRVGQAAAKGFADDDCADKASALTFYSLLSIVPVLAVAFGIAKGFGFEKHLEAEISDKLLEQREVVAKLIEFAHNALENSESGLIAGVGLVVLFWSVLKLLSSIESSFNAIWKVKKLRPLARRISDYLAMMLFCPIFFAASSSLTVFITTELVNISKTYGVWETVSPLMVFAFHLFPLMLSWLLFTALYYVMPNTRVPWAYALVAGIIAGTVYQIVQWIYIQFQIGLSSYGAVYGSFAAIPLFLIWLNTSWLIALAGAEIAYHAEDDLALEIRTQTPLQRSAEARVCGLLIAQQCIQAFVNGGTPPSVYALTEHTGISSMIVRQIIAQLMEASILSEVQWKGSTYGHYQPGKDLKQITVKAVCDALDSSKQQRYLIAYDKEAEKYEALLVALDQALEKDPQNCPLEQLLPS